MTNPSNNWPSWLNQARIYHVYLPSFKDTNGDGIGDLPGVIEKLDYIRDLGFNTVWLSPCFDSPFNDGGYDIRDYYKVASRYGTEQDLVDLCRMAREKDMRVLLDLVIGHTSIEHQWFQESARPERNPYSDWYIWTDSVFEEADVEPGKFISGFGDRNGNFLANFFYHQPALNHGFGQPDPAKPWQHPVGAPELEPLIEETERMMRYWLDRGASGFRMDLAGLMVKNDPTREGTRKYWRRWRKWFDCEYPEAALLAEWGKPDEAVDCGFHLDFMLHSYNEAYNSLFRFEPGRNVVAEKTGPSYFSKEGKGDINCFRKYYEKYLAATDGAGYVLVPSGNHDLPRLRNARSVEEIKPMMVFLLTLPGTPCIYYGDEIGLPYQKDLHSHEGGYNRTGSRTPMQWEPGPQAGFSSASPEEFYLPVEQGEQAVSVQEQAAKADSLLTLTRNLLRLRCEKVALGNQSPIAFCNTDQAYPLVYRRGDAARGCWVCINPSPAAVTLSAPLDAVTDFDVLLDGGAKAEMKDGTIIFEAPPKSWCVVEEIRA